MAELSAAVPSVLMATCENNKLPWSKKTMMDKVIFFILKYFKDALAVMQKWKEAE